MNDRELLEMSAKAAMINGKLGDKFNIGEDEVDCTDLFFVDDDSNCAVWNPLTDDGDALRLAVKLEMQVCVGLRRIDAVIASDSDEASICVSEPKTGDLYAATRRAIVRAAAEIGKAMP